MCSKLLCCVYAYFGHKTLLPKSDVANRAQGRHSLAPISDRNLTHILITFILYINLLELQRVVVDILYGFEMSFTLKSIPLLLIIKR